ncbi:MAG: hypothetical protein ABI867_33615 [Kofleriaceae bacterium]
MSNEFCTIEINALTSVTGGDGKDTYSRIGGFFGSVAGGAGGAAGGAALAAPLSPVGQAAAAGAGGVAGERVGNAVGSAAGRGLWNAGSWIGDKVGNLLYPSK